MIQETDIVKLSNHYIEKKSELSFTARKLFISIAFQIQKLGIKEAGKLELSGIEINEMVGINLKNPKIFIDAFSELREKTIVIQNNKGTNTKIFGVVNSAEMTDKKVIIEINSMAFPHIQNLTKNFTKLQALDVQKLEHRASLVIYKLLKQYLNTRYRSRTIKIDELKEFLGVSGKYKAFTNFKREILELAKKELKEKCTIYFDYELIKYGRRYDKIKFIIKERKQETKTQIDYKKIYEEEKLAKADELSENYTEKMVDMYELLYGTDPDTRLFNFEANGKPKQLLMRNLILLHFMNDFSDFEKWKLDYIN